MWQAISEIPSSVWYAVLVFLAFGMSCMVFVVAITLRAKARIKIGQVEIDAEPPAPELPKVPEAKP